MLRFQRIILVLVVGLSIGVAKRWAFRSALSGGAASDNRSTGTRLAQTVSGDGLSHANISLLMGGAVAYCFVLGLVSHLLLGDRGIGRYLGSLVAFASLVGTIFVYSRLFGFPKADGGLPLIVASLAAPVFSLVAVAVAKSLILNGGQGSGSSPAATRMETLGRLNAVSADRLNMALNRKNSR